MAKTTIKWILVVYLVFTLGTIAWQEAQTKTTIDNSIVWDKDSQFVVTYFHADKRCHTCNNMEAFTKETLETFYKEQLKSGKVKLKIRNWQDPANGGFVKNYELMGNAVILSDISNGKETRFKNLEDIWSLANDQKAYMDYIHTELQAWIGGV